MLKIGIILFFLFSFSFGTICSCTIESPGSPPFWSWCKCPKAAGWDGHYRCYWRHRKGRATSWICDNKSNCPPYMKQNELRQCVPNPDISPKDCAAKGGKYVDGGFSSLSSIDNAFASLSGTGCYSPAWVHNKENSLKNKIKNLVTPKHALLAAIALSPIGKIFKIPGMLDSLFNSFKKSGGNVKMLQDNKPIINMKYNPETGTYEPEISYTPRQKPLEPGQLLSPPKNTEDAQNIIDASPDLKNFENSPFADIPPENAEDLGHEMFADDLDKPQGRTRIADDLRDIFKRSKQEDNSNLPTVINKPNEDMLNTPATIPLRVPDPFAPGGQIPAIAKRTVKPLGGNIYDVMYNIKPQGAAHPTIVHYTVTLTGGHAQVVPKYKIKPNTYVTGRSGNLYSPKLPFAKPTLPAPNSSNAPGNAAGNSVVNNYYNTTNNYYEKNDTMPDVTTFQKPTQDAITKAFNYKIALFSCPDVSPSCPNPTKLQFPLAGKTYKLDIPDPICAVIADMDNPDINTEVNTAGNLLVLMAGVLGALSLFRRN